ncbi:MAG TPA: hypothetical protein VME01_06585 [Solirubrobacteraceae bacterium]|nr:hypothetical protein [Solirubrobacteraceae bacterium]
MASAAALTLSACGSASHRASNLAASGATQSQTGRLQSDAVRFTGCMRAHGIADFPDPPTAADPSAGRAWKSAFDNQSPGFRAAESACQHLMPAGGQHSQGSAPNRAQTAAMLAFSRCVRGHGFPDFPDPTAAGITHQMVTAAGINLRQPAVLQAADACVKVTHGYITRAVVARFIAGQ